MPGTRKDASCRKRLITSDMEAALKESSRSNRHDGLKSSLSRLCSQACPRQGCGGPCRHQAAHVVTLGSSPVTARFRRRGWGRPIAPFDPSLAKTPRRRADSLKCEEAGRVRGQSVGIGGPTRSRTGKPPPPGKQCGQEERPPKRSRRGRDGTVALGHPNWYGSEHDQTLRLLLPTVRRTGQSKDLLPRLRPSPCSAAKARPMEISLRHRPQVPRE